MKSIELDYTKRCAGEPTKGHNRWHPDIPPAVEAVPGEEVVLQPRHALDGEVTPSSKSADMGNVNLSLIHPLTGPVYVQGAEPGDLLEAWGGVPDHLQADFGRWLRQSDEAHKEQAAEAGISLDSGPGAARAAVAQLDANTLFDRGVIIAGNPESCIKNIKMYQDIGVDEIMMIIQTETIPHERVMESLELFGKEVILAFGEVATTAVAG